MDKQASATAEIIRFHEAIAAWFRGETPNNATTAAALTNAFHPDFKMIGAKGKIVPRSLLGEWLTGLHGNIPDIQISVHDITLHLTHDNLVLMTYREVQETGGTSNERYSSAFFTIDEQGRAWWLYLQETWAPAAS